MKWKHIIGDVEVNRDLVLLLLIGGLYTLAISLSNTFVNIYLWKQTQNYVNLGLYNLASVVLQPLTFLVGGKLAKRIDRSILLRIGVGTLAIFFYRCLSSREKCFSVYSINGGSFRSRIRFLLVGF